jgi:hypothetical protein
LAAVSSHDVSEIPEADMNREPLITEIASTIAAGLPPTFVRSEKWSWRRDHGWRTDHVYAVVRQLSVAVNADVCLPPEPDSGFDYQTLAVVNLPALAGATDTLYRFAQGARLVSNLSTHLELALKWFDQFQTPEACLSYLVADRDRNPQSPAYKYCRRYLSALADNSPPTDGADGTSLG